MEERIYRLEKISHTTLRGLDPLRTLVMATVSPLEVHGPHLPVGQDLLEACTLQDRAALQLVERRPDWKVLILPPVPLGTDCIPHLGSVNVPPHLVTEVAYRLLEPFARNGFTRLAYTSFHGGPRHVCALEEAADQLSEKYGVAAVSLFSLVISRIMEGEEVFEGIKDTKGRRIVAEQLRQDHHAAFTETSLGLHLWPELVDAGWQDLPPLVMETSQADREVNQSYLYGYQSEAGLLKRLGRDLASALSILRSISHFRRFTYLGYPGLASAEEGRDLFNHLVAITLGLVEEFLDRGREMDVHSPLWKLRSILLSSSVDWVVEDWLKIFVERGDG